MWGQGIALAKVGKWKASLGNTSPEHQGAFPALPSLCHSATVAPEAAPPAGSWSDNGMGAGLQLICDDLKARQAYGQKQSHTQTDYPHCSGMKT